MSVNPNRKNSQNNIARLRVARVAMVCRIDFCLRRISLLLLFSPPFIFVRLKDEMK